jgi:hypothetical protein
MLNRSDPEGRSRSACVKDRETGDKHGGVVACDPHFRICTKRVEWIYNSQEK